MLGAVRELRLGIVCRKLGVENLDNLTPEEVEGLLKKTDKQLEQLAAQVEAFVGSQAAASADELNDEAGDDWDDHVPTHEELDADDRDLEKLFSQASAPPPTPAKKQPAARQEQPPAPQLGWGKDGLYRCTDAQLRDPAWCNETYADREKAGENLRIIS